jgi:hypothetical protein
MRLRSSLFTCLLAVLLAGCQRVGGEAFQETFNQPLALTDDVPVGQSFRPATGAVAGVNVLLATFGTEPDQDGVLTVRLSDGIGGPLLGEAQVEGARLGDNEWAPLNFPTPVPAPDVAAIELRWDGTGEIAVWAAAPLPDDPDGFVPDPYPGGELVLDWRAAPGDLAFRVVGTGGAGALPGALAAIARQGAGRLAQDPHFMLGWLALLAAAGWLALGGLRQRRPREQHGEDQEGRAQQSERLGREDGLVEQEVAEAGQARGQLGGERLERAERRP